MTSSIVPTGGPVIPISLFPDAMRAGASVGNSVKTPLQAVAEGFTTGVKNYQDYVQNEQQIDINQAKLEAIPLDMEIKRQEILHQQAVDELDRMKLEVERATYKAKIENETEAARQEASVLRGNTKFADAFRQGQFDENVLNDPDVAAAAMKNPKMLGGLIGKTNADGTPAVRPETQKSILSGIDALETYKIDEHTKALEAKLHASLFPDLDKVSAEIQQKGSNIQYIMSQNGLTAGDYVDRVMTRPAGISATKTVKRPDGSTYEVWDRTQPDQDASATKAPWKFDAFVLQPDGTYVKQIVGLDNNEQGLHNNFISAYNYRNPGRPRWSPSPQPAPDKPKKPSDPFTNRVTLAPGQSGVSTSGAGSVSFVSPTPKVSPTAAPNPTPPPEVPVSAASTDAVTNRVRERLQRRAASNPRLLQSLQSEGLVPKEVTVSSPKANGPVPGTIAPNSKEALADSIGIVGSKSVNKEVINKVNADPALTKLSPLMKAVAAVESGGNRSAKSPTGATGLFQLTDIAVKDLKQRGIDIDENVPEQNIAGGVAYLGRLVNKYSDKRYYPGSSTVPALIAYNVGEGVVDKIKELSLVSNPDDIGDWAVALEFISKAGYFKDKDGKAYPSAEKVKEARAYPAKVLAFEKAFSYA